MNKVVRLLRQEQYLDALWEAMNIIEHDAHCWEAIRDKHSAGTYTYTFAHLRAEALQKDCSEVYEAIIKIKEINPAISEE